jgi:hypothetical protein
MLLPALVFLALIAFAGALLWSPLAGRAAYLHLMLAVGAMPLIFGAMSHFIPVLTRTRTAAASIGVFPLLALVGGAMAVAAFSLPSMAWAWRVGAVLALVAAIALWAWGLRRRAIMVGRPHPCLAWYEVALACLALALLAILATAVWPHQFSALRRLHLHLNTLGFVGMTTTGTLAVLMPTVIGRPDPQAGQWLSFNLAWAVAGTLLVAVGSAWSAPLTWVGAALWTIPLVGMAARWLRLYQREILALHGAAPLLAAALVGFALSIGLDAMSTNAAAGGLAKPDPAKAFVAAFLLPLVSGAAGQLLPVWLRPGVQDEWHAALRRSLGRYGGMRAVLFLIGGMTAGLGRGCGLLLSAATLLWFLVQAFMSLLQAINSQQGNEP